MSQKHGFNTWENYLKVHENVLKRYSGYFDNQAVSYSIERITENYYCLILERIELITDKSNVIFAKIEKDVLIQAGVTRKIAKTYGYTYNSWKKDKLGNSNLTRYCSPHTDHNKFHHKHDYTVVPATIIKIDNDSWPHVSEFLDELIHSF